MVYGWVGFHSRPNAPNLQKWVNFGKFGQKSAQLKFVANWVFFLRQFGIVMGHDIALFEV